MTRSAALSCRLPCGVNFHYGELQFPLLLEVRRVNTPSPGVAQLLRTFFFNLTRHQDPAISQLCGFHTADLDHLSKTLTLQRRSNSEQDLREALAREQEHSPSRKTLSIILLFNDNFPSVPEITPLSRNSWWLFSKREEQYFGRMFYL